MILCGLPLLSSIVGTNSSVLPQTHSYIEARAGSPFTTKSPPPFYRARLSTSCKLERMWCNNSHSSLIPTSKLYGGEDGKTWVNASQYSLTWVRIFLVSISSSSEGQLPFRGFFFHLFDPIAAIQFGSLVWQHFILWRRQSRTWRTI